MVEVTEETLLSKEKEQPPLKDYEDLTVFLEGVKAITEKQDPYGFALDWEVKLRKHFENTPLEKDLDRLIVLTPILDLMVFEKDIQDKETVLDWLKKESIRIQREVTESIVSAQDNPRGLSTLETQVAYLERAFDTNTALLGYNRGLLNGIRGMVATKIAFERNGYETEFPTVEWDIEHDVDLIAKHKRTGQKLAVSIKCFAKQDSLNIVPLDLREKPEQIREEFDGAVRIFVPGPQKRSDIFKKDFLGIPNDYLVRQFKARLIVP